VLRSAATLLIVPVPVVLRTITRTRRSGWAGRSTVIQAAAQFRIKELVFLAAGTSLDSRRGGDKTNNSGRNGNDASKRLHVVVDLSDDKV